MIELKPCPFCGRLPYVYRPWRRLFSRDGGYAVRCESCDLDFGRDIDYGGDFDNEEEAREAWNRRAE